MESVKQKIDRARFYSAVFVIIRKGDKLLLQKRQNTGFMDGMYSPVAGHVDGGADIAGEASREAKEEVGIIVKPTDLKVVYVAHQIGSGDREYINFYLEALDWSGEPQNLEPEFCSEVGWYAENSLPSNLQPDVAFALGNIQKGITFGEFDWRSR